MRSLSLFGLSLTILLAGACSGPLRFPLGGAPTPAPGECAVVRGMPAPIFHVAFLSPATAGATVSLEPWVFLAAPLMKHDEVLPETFEAKVDAQAREIVVSGQVRATRPNPGADCAYPAIYTFPKVATLSLPVVLTATGTYTVRIASDSFTTQRPESVQHPSEPPKTYPEAVATRSLVIE